MKTLTAVAWLIFLGAASLEVGGDAIIRRGLYGHRGLLILLGCLMLGAYGLLVNAVRWDFSKLIGVYVAVFATASILTGRFYFREMIPTSTWMGLGFVILGALVIQFGPR
jgi:drug/metabolite transporter superfamily protein YnfA